MKYPEVIIENHEEDIDFENEGTEQGQEIVLINGKEV